MRSDMRGTRAGDGIGTGMGVRGEGRGWIAFSRARMMFISTGAKRQEDWKDEMRATTASLKPGAQPIAPASGEVSEQAIVGGESGTG